jgi:hypothetical protein
MMADHNGKKLGGKRCDPFSATKSARLGLAIQWLTDGWNDVASFDTALGLPTDATLTS